MRANELDPLLRRDHGGDEAGLQTGAGVTLPRRPTEERLSRGADQHGEAQPSDLPRVHEQLEALLGRFPESEARVDHDPVRPDPLGSGRVDPVGQPSAHFAPKVRVREVVLHRGRDPAHVHDHGRRSRAGDDAPHRVRPEPFDVVHDVRARIDGERGDLRVTGIDRHGNGDPPGQTPEDRFDPLPLDVGPRPGPPAAAWTRRPRR